MSKSLSDAFVTVFLFVVLSLALALPIRNCGLELFEYSRQNAKPDQRNSLSAYLSSGPPATELNKTYGTVLDEGASSVVQTSDGGYSLAGWKKKTLTPMGYYNAWFVKTNASGHMEWSREYGGGATDSAHSVVQTIDGGYALAGNTMSFAVGYNDLWLIKTDATGNMQWNVTLGGAFNEYAESIVQTTDKGYILAGGSDTWGSGYRNYDFWLVKTNATGDIEWDRTYGQAGNDWEWAYSVVQTSDGGYAVAGYTNSSGAGNYDFWLVKTNATGDIEWDRTYGGTEGDIARSVVQTIDGGYALAGWTFSFGAGSCDWWLVKTNATGEMEWSRTYGGSLGDWAYSVSQASDGGYALAGSSVVAGGYDLRLVKTDSAGTMKWNMTCGGSMKDEGYSVVHTNDGGYALVGVTYSFGAGNGDFWLLKTGRDPDLIDSDGDGLLDTWEIDGIDYNSDDNIDLILPGADSEHKDLYIEIDYMGSDGTHDHNPDPDAIADVVDAFANAPVNNPDGADGITLHIEVDESIPHQNVITVWDDFNNIKKNRFGTVAHRNDPNSVNILAAKKMACRYALFIHQYARSGVTRTSSGIAELPGNDFIVSLGAFTNSRGTRDEQAGTLMHEFGHTLNLRHGGGDNINGKPNYLSIMSYSRQFSSLISGRRLDYSRSKLPTLAEGNLNENLGIQGPPGDQTVSGPLVWNATAGRWQAFVDQSQGPIDWNRNGVATETGISRSINNFTAFGFGDTSLGNLEGHDDWANILYNFRFTGEFKDGLHLQEMDQEITWEIVEQMKNATIVGFHDIAVTDVTCSKTIVGAGHSASVNITVFNRGYYTETTNVSAYYGNATITPEQWETFWSMGDVNRDGHVNDTDGDLIKAAWGSSPGDVKWCPWADINQDLIVNVRDRNIFNDNYGLDIWTSFISGAVIGTQLVNSWAPENYTELSFAWNTLGVAFGNYTVSAYAVPVLCEEASRVDNTLANGFVMVTIPGDINGDRRVDGPDLEALSEAFGSTATSPNWNPIADLNENGIVDIFDIRITGKHWYESW